MARPKYPESGFCRWREALGISGLSGRVEESAMRSCALSTHWPLLVCWIALLGSSRHGAARNGPLPPVGRPVEFLVTGPDPLD